jgi:hypothetical protein
MKPTCRELLDGGWTNADMELLAARVERVLALHSRSGGGDQPICFSCDEAWPCWTIRILDGEEDK